LRGRCQVVAGLPLAEIEAHLRHEIEQARSQACRRDEVQRIIGDRIDRVRINLLAAPTQLAFLLIAQDKDYCRSQLQSHLTTLMENFPPFDRTDFVVKPAAEDDTEVPSYPTDVLFPGKL
jgi:hypothetical protein